MSRRKIDVSTLSGWSSLSSGQHSITLKAKASGYVTSEESVGILIQKLPTVYTVTAMLANVTAAPENPTTINTGETKSLTYYSDDGLNLPADVIVTGATKTGWVVIDEYKVSGTATNCLIDNASTSSKYVGTHDILAFTLSADGTSYKLPTTLSIPNATYTRTSDTVGKLVFSNVSADQEFSVVAEAKQTGYTVVLNLNSSYVNVVGGAGFDYSEDYVAADGTVYNIDAGIDSAGKAHWTVNGTAYTEGSSYTLPKLITKVKMHDTTVQNYITYSKNGSSYTHDFGSGDFILTSNITVLGQGYGSCIDENTLITLYDGTEKAMKDIEIGDEVLSIDYDAMKLVSRKVVYTSKDDPAYDNWNVPSYYLHTFSDGTTIKRAMNHRFYNLESQGYKYMHEWENGQHAYNLDGTNPALINTEIIQEPLHYAKITLEDSNNFFANGLSTGDRKCCPNPVILDRKLYRDIS